MDISASQLEHLDKLAEQGFVERLEAFLIEEHARAVEGLTPQQLRRRVLASIARGRAHGFTWETALAAFAVMMFEMGPEFDRLPAFVRALKIRPPHEGQRIAAIYDNTTDEDWTAARALGGANAWAAVSGMSE